ncbi:nitrate- and nitrite sensing domain-containing protein [Streptomyces bambusae]|uniref:sensor histidine kinase n=1 Tax=Streptomyces bambusae TaxID=1550616 RepID=UPI001CFC9ABE|nr:nitrate- and nitrite sensing domain-containing protein [Streptomyces bambusae]MCB5164615.1 nitrate- and nitrite sensing domain-containing protein [Streptomyces bambusae]
MRMQREGRKRLPKVSLRLPRSGRPQQDPPPPAADPPPQTPPPPRGGRRLHLGDLRVRTRLLAVIAIPLLVATVLGALRVNSALDVAGRYEQFHEVAQLARTGTELVQQLQHERDVAIDPQAATGETGSGLTAVREKTNELEQRFTDESSKIGQTGQLKTRLAAVKEAFAEFPQIRTAADHEKSGTKTDTAYLGLIMPLLGIDNELDGQLAQSHSRGWGLYTLALSTSMLSSERALMSQSAEKGALSPTQRASLLATVMVRDMAQREFTMAAPPADRAAYAKITESPAAQNAEKALQQMLAAPEDLAKAPDLPANWYADFGTRVQALDELGRSVSDQLVSESKAQYDDAMTQARIDAGITAGLLVAALGLAFAVSRSISQGLARLHGAATDVAEVRLPHLMRDLQDNPLAAVDLHVPTTGIATRDDIGDVAQAFDAVHREAVRLAGDQARLRESVSTLFRNLSHRNQSLVQRQLSILTTLEQHEDDGVQLKRLFELDHLAARMRRNSENLLVLAGGQSTSRAARPMSLLDVVRTAMSEVEQFERVGHPALPPVFVAGYAVSDVVHLLSELLENALMFSSPQTEVQIGCQQLPDGRVLVEVRDHGIGMDAAKLEVANSHFASGEALAPDASAHMGLYVVGLLARRHGIEVALRAAASGTSALVILPQELAVRVAAQPDAVQSPPAAALPYARPEQPIPAAEGPGAAPAAAQTGPTRPPGRPDPSGPGRPEAAGGPPSDAPSGRSGPAFPPPPAPAADGSGQPAAPRTEPAAGPGGLPRRVPMAHLLPGSVAGQDPYAPQAAEHGAAAEGPAATGPAAAAAPPFAAPSAPPPERLRSRLGALHQGIARAADEDVPQAVEGDRA